MGNIDHRAKVDRGATPDTTGATRNVTATGRALGGRKVLVTSGPTRGPIDAVRFIGNKSTGKLGSEIASEALRRGASVVFVYGKDSLRPSVPPEEAERFRAREVETVEDLAAVAREELESGRIDVVVHAMAVLDFAPAEYRDEKTKSDREEWVIRLVRTPKVLAMIKDWDPGVFLVGFKLEFDRTHDDLLAIGLDSLRRNRADLVVVNDFTTVEKGEHAAFVVHPDGRSEGPFVGKTAIAAALLDRVTAGLGQLRTGSRWNRGEMSGR